MKKMFRDLRIGEKFYPPIESEKMDLRIMLIKVSQLSLTGEPPWNTKATKNVYVSNGQINAVVIGSPDNETTGYFDFFPDDLMVYPENLMC